MARAALGEALRAALLVRALARAIGVRSVAARLGLPKSTVSSYVLLRMLPSRERVGLLMERARALRDELLAGAGERLPSLLGEWSWRHLAADAIVDALPPTVDAIEAADSVSALLVGHASAIVMVDAGAPGVPAPSRPAIPVHLHAQGASSGIALLCNDDEYWRSGVRCIIRVR